MNADPTLLSLVYEIEQLKRKVAEFESGGYLTGPGISVPSKIRTGADLQAGSGLVVGNADSTLNPGNGEVWLQSQGALPSGTSAVLKLLNQGGTLYLVDSAGAAIAIPPSLTSMFVPLEAITGYPKISDHIPTLTERTTTPVAKRYRGANILSDWWGLDGTGTYVSASQFTIPGDWTSNLKLGGKLIFTNSSVKYGYVLSSSYSSPNTTVNIVPNTTYPLVNAAITSIAVSYSDPPDFPSRIAYTATPTNYTLGNGTLTAYFTMNKGIVTLRVYSTMGTTSAMGTSPSFALPVSGIESGSWNVVLRDTSINNYVGHATANSTHVFLYKVNVVGATLTYSGVTATTPFTWGDTDFFEMTGTYMYA